MPTKPSDTYTWATDTNFSSGPASGNPTKVNPPGWPAVAQGSVPGLGIVAEYYNKKANVDGQWINNWLLVGSNAGAADAHLVETDASGNTKLQNLSLIETSTPVLTFGGSIVTPTDGTILFAAMTGIGVGVGGSFFLDGQAGRTQSGGADNNDGGAIVIESGVRGTGGSGTGGKGFGGAARDGRIEINQGGGTRRMYYEEADLASGAGATKFLNIPVGEDKTTVLLKVQVISTEDGGGAGLKTAIQEYIYRCRREGTTVTITATGTNPFVVVSDFTTNAPPLTVTSVGDGTIDINLAGAPSQNSANAIYVDATIGRISA